MEREASKMTFSLIADATFEAEDIDAALVKLAYYFLKVREEIGIGDQCYSL